MPNDFLWLAAIGTVIASAWRYIQMAWNALSSLVVLKVEIDGLLAYEIMGHLWESSTKSIPLNPRKFTSWHVFVRDAHRDQMVPFETLGKSGIIFFTGWRPVWVLSSVKEESDGPKHEPDEEIVIRYLRGTYDIEKIITTLATERNQSIQEFRKNAKAMTRFRVARHIGTRGRVQSDKSGAVIEESGSSWPVNERSSRRRRPIGQTWDNLGESPTDAEKSPFDYLAYPAEVLEVVRRLQWWLDNREWFIDRRIPWRRGVELIGPPGSGKSSLVRAVGEQFRIPVHLFDLASMTNEDFMKSWAEASHQSPCIIALEDVDSVFEGRENMTSNVGQVPGLSFDCLLNCISGVARSDGVLLFVTTNKPDVLDSALVRKGRIDEQLVLDGIDEKCRNKIARIVMGEDSPYIKELVKDGVGDQPVDFHGRCATKAEELLWAKYVKDGSINPKVNHRNKTSTLINIEAAAD